MNRLLLVLFLLSAASGERVTLLARIGKTISHIEIDPVTLHISESRPLYRPIGEELQVSLAVDSQSQAGFFTLGSQLHRVTLNGSASTAQLTLGGVLDDTPTAIAYEWMTRKIYIAISTIGPDNSARIEVCEDAIVRASPASPASACTVILHDRLDYLHSLVLDPADGNMYWINALQNRIERAFMDGRHHDANPFLNPASSEGATLTSLALSRESGSLFYVRTTKDRSELWSCRLYERQSCARFFETKLVLHLAVHGKYAFVSLSTGRLAICEHANCAETFHEVEQMNELEVFHVVSEQVQDLKDADDNPCGRQNGGCSHFCLVARIAPKRTCACPIGVRLMSDAVTCEQGFNEVLLISAITGLYYISLDTSDYTPQAIPYQGHEESSHSLFDVDYDPVEGFVYWLDTTDTAIKRCRFNGSDLSIVAQEGVQTGTKTFKLDVFGRNIFWVDGDTQLIWVGKMDGSLTPRVIDLSLKFDNPHGIAVDSVEGHLYVTDWVERSSRIVRMNFDGSDAQVFYALQEYSFPTGIELDRAGGRLYWTESNHSLIRSIKLDATDLLTYMHTSYKLSQPYSVSKLGNRIYCNSMAGRSFVEIVLRDGILAGHDSSRVVESQIYGPVGLRAVRLNETVKSSGPCGEGKNGGCAHFCLTKSRSTARCVCARGYDLQADSKSCVKATSSVVLLDGSGKRGELVRMPLKGPRNLERLHLQGLSATPHDIVFDQMSSSIYIASSNDSAGTIERVNLTASLPRATLVLSGVALRGLSHLALEPTAHLIVFSNSELGRIEACSLEGRHQRALAWEGIRPTLIEIDRVHNSIIYVNESVEESTISRMRIAVMPRGGEPFYRTTSQIVALAIETRGEEIYWAEHIRGTNSLHRMKMDGREAVVLSRSEERRLAHLQYRDNALYYIDSKKNEFGFYDAGGFHPIHSGVKSVRDFVFVHPPPFLERKRACSVSNGGCPELCLPQSAEEEKTEVCVCGDHRYYDVVSKTCQMNSHGIVLASNGRLLLLSARNQTAMLNKDHSPLTTLPIERVGVPMSVAVDDLSRFATVYWIDANEPKFIRSASTKAMSTTIPQSLQVTACAHLRALTVDTYGRQLFVSCVAGSGRSHVIVFRIQASSALLADKLLHIGRVVNGEEVSPVTGKRPVPTELAAGAGKLVYLDVSTRSGRPILVVCGLDGRNCARASERTQGYSRLSLLPRAKKLLFTGDDTVNSLDLRSLETTPIEGMERSIKALFTSVDGERVAMVPIDEKEDSFLLVGSERLLIPGLARVTAMTSFTMTSESAGGHFERARSCLHQECTHLCSYTGESYECLCPLGFTIAHDSSSICMQNVTCKEWEFLCRDQRTCIHAGAKCDGRMHCPDGSDEGAEMCAGMDATTWRCADGRALIDRYLVCDGTAHCEDGSDERACNCHSSSSSSSMDCALFGRMAQSECVERRLRCNHKYECSNGADEEQRLCTAFPPETAAFRLTFSHIMFGAIAFLLLMLCCSISLFFCYSKKRTSVPVTSHPLPPDRRYHTTGHADPALLVPLSGADHYEMRAYSIVDSTSTYPSLPPPIQSMCGGDVDSIYAPLPQPVQHSRDHPSRFYAPPPSTASLSTYGIVLPSFNASTHSQRRIVITEHLLPSPSIRSGLSPPPAYLVRTQPPRSGRELPSVRGRKASHTSTPCNSRKDPMRSRATLNESRSPSIASEHDSVSLSSHSSEGAPPTTSRRDV